VFGKRLHQLRGAAGDDVHDAIRKIAGFENLIEIASNQRIFLRRNGDGRVARCNGRHHQGQKSEQWRIRGAHHPYRSNRFLHCQRDVAKRRIMHSAVVLIGPRGVGKDALDAEANFGFRLLLTDDGGQPGGDFFATLGKILRDVVEDLRAIMCGRFAPTFGFARCFDSVANVFAVAKRRFS